MEFKMAGLLIIILLFWLSFTQSLNDNAILDISDFTFYYNSYHYMLRSLSSTGSISIYNKDLQTNITIITDFVTTNLILHNINDNTMIKLNFSNDNDWDEITITSPVKDRKPSEIFHIESVSTISPNRHLLGDNDAHDQQQVYDQKRYGHQQSGGNQQQ